MDHRIPAKRTDLVLANQSKRTFRLVDLVVPAEHRLKIKQKGKKGNFLDIARELKTCETSKTNCC